MQQHAQRLDRTSPVPLYYQLFLRMRSEIQGGIIRPGDLLGTEKEIQRQYAVSRATVRKALEELARSGQVVRITGRGTFVSEPAAGIQTPHLLSLTEEMLRRGVAPGSRLLDFDRALAPPHAAEALGVREGTPLIHIRRLRTGDGQPIVLVEHYFHPAVRLDAEDLAQSVYETLENRVGVRLQEAFHTVRAGTAHSDEAGHLEIERGDPVLRFERTTLSAEGRAIVYERGTARADRYEYSVHLYRK